MTLKMIMAQVFGQRLPIKFYTNVPGCNVEVLTPDFKGNKFALSKVLNANPEIYSHNVMMWKGLVKELKLIEY